MGDEKKNGNGPSLAGGLVHGQGLGNAFARTLVALILSALLLPLVSATAAVFKERLVGALVNIHSIWRGSVDESWRCFWGGVLVYVILHLLFPTRWMKFLLDHDPVRRLFEWLAAKPALGGWSGLVRVVMYSLPVYTLALLGGILLTDHFAGLKDLGRILAFATGLAYAFHVAWVVLDLRRRQPEMGFAPYLLSLIVVFLCNIQVVVVLLNQFVKNDNYFDWVKFNQELWTVTRASYLALFGGG